MVARWRLQLLAEETYGVEARRASAMEAASITRLEKVTRRVTG